MPKIDPTDTLQSMFDEPSNGSNTTQYLPAANPVNCVSVTTAQFLNSPARAWSTIIGSSFSSDTITLTLRVN